MSLRLVGGTELVAETVWGYRTCRDVTVCGSQDMSLSKREKLMALDTHLFGERDTVEVRSDLADSEIYICSPEVLMLFSDNFDYQVCPLLVARF